MDIFDRVLAPYLHDAEKHGHPDPERWAEEWVNSMDNIELLRAISDAIKEQRNVVPCTGR